jgi:UDP-N-acetyl-alpha-D-muramoyl-L-alanyl-L-glutamate epimerase
MKTYEAFHITSYNWDKEHCVAKFHFQFDDDCTFTEVITFPKTSKSYNEEELQKSLQALHVVLGLSYYKAYAPNTIAVHTTTLTEQQKKFFTTIYEKGLGEFWYKNDIDWRKKIHFINTSQHFATSTNSAKIENRKSKIENPLVPIGGGKDSVVTISLLQKAGITPTLFRVGSHPLITKQAQIAQCPLLTIERSIDPKLQKLNENGVLNGHIPITAIVSCIGICTAILHGHDAVIFSNEHSANEGNTFWKDLEVNHQWSKSFEFESMFRTFLQEEIQTNIAYFSLLRPLTEVAITRHFAGLPQYYFCTTSSNSNWRIWKEKATTLWGEDEKSAFVFALYLTALEEDTVLEIFDDNLFSKPQILETYRQLLGIKDIKPFECVGTAKEVQYAFLYCLENGKMLHTEAMQMFKDEALLDAPSIPELEEELFAIHNQHFVPEDLLTVLKP